VKNWLDRQLRPALLSRLGHIIFIQVLFVFAAILLILFFPENDTYVDFRSVSQHHLAPIEKAARSVLVGHGETGAPILHQASGRTLRAFLDNQSNCDHLEIYISSAAGHASRVFTYDRDRRDFEPLMAAAGLSESLDMPQDGAAFTAAVGQWQPLSLGAGHSAYRCWFETGAGEQGMLVAVVNQDWLVSNRGSLLYGLLLLFLGSILVSLLTVHLISRRFREPLKRLEQGLEKTAAGQLYYLLEIDGDTELNRLVTSFNSMSKTLWQNQQTLKKYNRLLKGAYITQAESQAFLATLIDCTPASVVVASPAGEVVIFNRMAAQVFGYENGEALGLTIDRLFAASRDAERSVATSDSTEEAGEVVCRRQDGSMFPAYLVVSQVKTGSGQPPAHLFIFLDISESKNFQEMMVSVDRYYTRGEMAGDIAHEINNYLAVLGGNIELMPLFLKRGDREKIDAKLELMKNTVDKIARFADGLMDVNQGEAQFAPTDLNQLIQNMLAFLKPQNRFDGIALITELSADLPLVELDQNQIQQTLINLIQNGADALVDHDGSKEIRIVTEPLPDEGSVRVTISDNGPGVEPDRQDALFEKRFTTKRKGHGYGLVTCRRIIDTHQGVIGYRSESGAVFFFELPVRRSRSKTESTESAATAEVPSGV